VTQPRLDRVEVGGAALATATWGAGVPTVVLLHDGLGSISQWRDLPARLHEALDETVLAYDRPGHGSSMPVPDGPWPVDWMQTQARLLGGLLQALGLDAPLLVGHSDGGSVALLHAAWQPHRVRGVVALAPHSFVETVCVFAIVKMRTEPKRWIDGLVRHHDHPAAVFEAWSGGWTRTEFASWDIRADLAGITTPVVVAQGDADEYATDAMVHETVAAIGPNAEGMLLAGSGHLVHHQDPDAVVGLVQRMRRVVG
jgi:pimeloyl-ACP methyl ester carboxylesterase